MLFQLMNGKIRLVRINIMLDVHTKKIDYWLKFLN